MDRSMWDSTMQAILNNIGPLRVLKLVVHINGNMVHYYFGSNKDLTGLSNRLEKMLLSPVSYEEIDIPQTTSSERFVQLVTGGNLLDLKERQEVNRNKSLEWAIFSMRSLGGSAVQCSADIIFKSSRGVYSAARKQLVQTPGHLTAINFRENERYGYRKKSRHLDIKKSLHILKSESSNALFEVDTFPYLPKNAFLSLDSYDFDRHSFILGATGSGKSKFIRLFVERLLASPRAQDYRIIVIDPHASLENDLMAIPSSNVVRFKGADDSTELFAEDGTDFSAATELTTTLLSTLLGSSFNPQIDKALRSSLLVLLTARIMSLTNLRRFLVDQQFRDGVLRHVNDYVPATATTFFGSQYQGQSAAIQPLVDLIDEVQLHSPGTGAGQVSSLGQVIAANRLTLFSLDKIGMGEKSLKAVSGLIIQQIFLLAQSRTFNEKVILIIDEVSVVQNPTIAQILAEARKYNLYVFLSQQYFGQIEKPLQDAVFSNVSNYYVFKVSESDARMIEGNITMELPKKMLMEATRVINKEEDLRVPILTSLDPRECVVRVSGGGKLLPAVKARTVDMSAPSRHKSVELKPAKPVSIPAKYVESAPVEQSAHRPEASPINSINLMEVLAKSSSHRNKRKK